MKKWICLLLGVASIFMGCSSKDTCSKLKTFMQNNGKPKVLSTIAMIDDLVQQIGGEQIDAICLVTGEIDPHSYELVKGDGEKFERADIVFANGLGLEHGASIQYQLREHKNCVVLGDHLYRQCRQDLLIIDGQLDPHVWMDMALWARIVDPIVSALSAKDPEHANLYQERGAKLKETLLEHHSAIYTQMQNVPEEKRFLVTSHDAFNYFARRYLSNPQELSKHGWKKRVAAPQGLAPDSQLSPADILEIISHLERYHIPVLFPESNVSSDALKKVVDASAKRGMTIKMIETPLFGDAMESSYIEMMRHNANVIAKSLHNE
ncbi:MAG: zinc ABC transporter substrate-binding protein [Chlamydiia bacterium]|nr:zinc ABC transporter substrate-binding protein [Chlamydiia bacterium]